jgi:hypothetical protein
MTTINAIEWWKIRTSIPPDLDMMDDAGSLRRANTYLKSESPRTSNPNWRFVSYNANYVKYVFLQHFYRLIAEKVLQDELELEPLSDKESSGTELIKLLAEVTKEFSEFYALPERIRERPIDNFRVFCAENLNRED